MWRLISLLNTGVEMPEAKTNGDIDDLLELLDGIVDNTILPIIYVVLGLFLVVKGALLGVQIVKAADEPQVRQEKINSLKWLVIGVAVTFAVVIAADVVLGYFVGQLSKQAAAGGTGGGTGGNSFLFK